MDRARSSLSRHRRRRLQEATQHVSPALELAASAAVARQRSYSPRDEGEDEGEAVSNAVRVLRNAKNGVYHRGLAARALGLLMLHDREVAARLRLEAEELVDALLQLVSYCRRASVQNADTRRVHVNCCLVISLLMQAPHQLQQARASLVVALDSELLVMDSKPAEASSAFLLLTVSGRPASGDGYREPATIDRPGALDHCNVNGGKRKAAKGSDATRSSLARALASDNQHESPPKKRKGAWPPKAPEGTPAPQPTPVCPLQQSRRSDLADALAGSVAGRSTPARVFKMDRFRVMTPAFASTTALQNAAPGPGRWPSSPVVNPAGGCVMDRAPSVSSDAASGSERTSAEASPPPTAGLSLSPAAPPSSASLMHPQHMLEILRTQQMPVASPAFFTRRLRESISRQTLSRAAVSAGGDAPSPPASRLPVVTWGEWKRQRADRGAGQSDDREEEEDEEDGKSEDQEEAAVPGTTGEQHGDHPPPLHASDRPGFHAKTQPPVGAPSPMDSQSGNTPEAKRQRLREILTSPIEPSEENALHLRSLARRVDSTTMATLRMELQSLTRQERGAREQLHALIRDERDRLPLKFLFALPGGAAYCRQRMRRAMALWLFTFEQNQRRLALLQWKAMVERARFVERGTAYHARAVQMRLKVAIAFVLRNFQQQALRRWVLVTQTQIWASRDQAARLIQARARQFVTRQRTLRAHRRARFGRELPCDLVTLRDDVHLASPRKSVKFRVPLEIRRDLRARWGAATCVQRRLRSRRFRAFLSRYRAAATKIQAVARMRAERARFAAIKSQIVAFQARVRMAGHRSFYLRLRGAALLVQRAFRNSRARRLRRLVKRAHYRLHEHRLTAALLLQRMARGLVGRRRARSIRLENAERFHASLVVQRAWYRRNNEFSTFLLLGCLREQEGEDRAFDARVLAFTRATSASRIHRAWLAYAFSTRDLAARQIQREVRGLVARRRVKELRRRRIARRRIKWFLRVRHADRVGEAAKIQFAWLRAVPGRLLRHLSSIRARAEILDARRRLELVHDSASRIQALARGFFHGRRFARHERGARAIQRAYRAFLRRKQHAELMARLRAEAAEGAALLLVQKAVRSAAATRLRTMDAAAVQVQRVARGIVTRSRLIATVVHEWRECQMASRIQRIWRENAWRRGFAQRARASCSLLEAQRRRQSPTNPFRGVTSITDTLELALALAGKYFDPRDELVGMGMHEWLGRNGLSARYSDAFQRRLGGDSACDAALAFVAKLRALDADACAERLRAIMAKASGALSSGRDNDGDDDEVEADVDALVTNLLASRTLREASELRRQLARDQKRHRDALQADSERRRRRVAIAESAVRHCQAALDSMLREAEDFRNPPRALSLQRDSCIQDLQHATRAVEQAKRELEAAVAREEGHAEDLARRRNELQREAPREAAAHASLDGFRVLGNVSSGDGRPSERDRVARAIFLERFPGLEARAAAFSTALAASGGASVTRTQLTRFFGLAPRRRKEITLSDVKAATPELTHFRFAEAQRQHDLLRFSAAADVLQLGLERLGELLGVSLEELALGRSRRGEADERRSRMEAAVVDALERSRARPECLPPAEHRARALRAGVDAVLALHDAAKTLQTRWRARAGRKLLLALRRGRQRAEVKAQYVAERAADRVTPLWERERQHEREEAAAYERERASLARAETLASIPRFPFVFRAWKHDLGVFVFRKEPDGAASGLDGDGDDAGYDAGYGGYNHVETEGEDYELEARHSTYSLAEDAAAVRTQALARGWLARRRVARLERARRRQRRRDALEREWDAARQERAQLVTLTVGVAVVTDAGVRRWRQARRRQARARQPMAAATAARGRKGRAADANAAAAASGSTSAGAEDALDALVARVERAYHRSARSEHQRDWTFPAAVRAPDANGRALLELLHAVAALERSAAPRGRVSRLELRFTKAALRFGWREARQADGARWFVHEPSGAASWAPPAAYSFAESAAATTLQALARQLAARRERARVLGESRPAAEVRAAVARVERLGAWTGWGLEGLTPAAALCLVGLARLVPSLAALRGVSTADELRAVPAELLRRELQWSAEDAAALLLLPEADRRAKAPLSTRWPPPPAALRFLPSARALAQLVARRFPNQQGRVQALVRAVAASRTPITLRQLEAHLRRYGGRPDEAASAVAMRELADLPPLARALELQRAAFHTLAHALDRALVLAANLALRGLQRELSAVRAAAWALVQPSEGADAAARDAERAFRRAATTLPLSPALSAREVAVERARALARPPVMGMWERSWTVEEDAEAQTEVETETEPGTETQWLTPAQAARYVRECGLERVLQWERSARLCQSLARMRPARARFLAWRRAREAAARTLQRVARGHEGRAQAARLAAQRASDFEQARDPRSGAVFYVFAPTRERFVDAPVDAAGRAEPFRPLVRDRETQRWLLAWPGWTKAAARRGQGDRAAEAADAQAAAAGPTCSECRAARAARRCGECATAAGDFVDLCLACFADAHAGHGFSALARAQAAALRCVECRRPSTRRCLPCGEHYCARCFRRVHARGLRRAGHRCEVYAPRAAACTECETRVAERRCLDCRDALCEPCFLRAHGGGGGGGGGSGDGLPQGRGAHASERLAQPLEDPAREAHCAQCQLRLGDARCPSCAALLCAVCALERREPHARACPETALELARARVLGRDALCAECGKPADRECAACGDRYCSVRWMGHAGCFERFHARGRRAQHEWREWRRPEPADAAALAAGLAELAALEEHVRAKRREDARRAELEAAALAAALRADGGGGGARAKAAAAPRTAPPRTKSKKRKANKPPASGVCAVEQCARRAAGPELRLCALHLTPQLALEAAEHDPLQAAKLLADAEREAAGEQEGLGRRLAQKLAALRPAAAEKTNKKRSGRRTEG